MNEMAESLNKKLEALEKGASLDATLADGDAEQAELLRLAAALRRFEPPQRNPQVVSSQIAAAQAAAQEEFAADKTPRRSARLAAIRSELFYPLAAAGGVFFILAACLALLGLGFGVQRGIAWLANPIEPTQATLAASLGLVEVQDSRGEWKAAKTGMELPNGARLRTAALSSAEIQFADGSQVRLGAETEITLSHMARSGRGARFIWIMQWNGTSEHQVAPSRRTDSQYQVRTLSSVSTALGTQFTIQVAPQGDTRVEVLEGQVAVSGMGSETSLAAGQVTTIAAQQPPAAPQYALHGEGILTDAAGGWQIAGQAVQFGDASGWETARSGDLVAFDGAIQPDGTFEVEKLTHLYTPRYNEFSINGAPETISQNALVAASTYIAVDAQTSLPAELARAETAIIEGVIMADGKLLSTRIYTPKDGQPFQITGIVQAIHASYWVVSGVTVQVDEATSLPTGAAIGVIVQASGWIVADGDWLAGSIWLVTPEQAVFDFQGEVEDTDPWKVAGILLETRAWTAIAPEIITGDLVRVRGYVQTDGAWIAAEIRLVEPSPVEIRLDFVGTLNQIDPWVVSGIVLVVDEQTEISGATEIGALVSVRAVRKEDSAWRAEQITVITPASIGCVTYAGVVEAISGSQVWLENGLTLDLSLVEQTEGEIEIGATLLVVQCLQADGTITYPLVKVIAPPPGETTPTPTATATATPTAAPTSIILPNCYQITFLGFTDNSDGTSTWRYRVEELSCAQDLSNWVLELPACASAAAASPSPWELVHPDPNIQLYGIKWEVGAGFERGEFSVTLVGDLDAGTIWVGAKGPDVATGMISGPVCASGTDTPTPTATLETTTTQTLTPTITGTPTETPTITPTPTETQAALIPPASSGTIMITDNSQTLAFTCSGNAVIVNGNANTITLYGSCSSLTVRGNANRIYVQNLGGLPVQNTGNGNIITER